MTIEPAPAIATLEIMRRVVEISSFATLTNSEVVTCADGVETAAAPFMESYHKGVTFRTGRPDCRQHMDTMRDLCCSGAFQPHRITTSPFDFDDAPEAWADEALRTACVRVE